MQKENGACTWEERLISTFTELHGHDNEMLTKHIKYNIYLWCPYHTPEPYKTSNALPKMVNINMKKRSKNSMSSIGGRDNRIWRATLQKKGAL